MSAITYVSSPSVRKARKAGGPAIFDVAIHVEARKSDV